MTEVCFLAEISLAFVAVHVWRQDKLFCLRERGSGAYGSGAYCISVSGWLRVLMLCEMELLCLRERQQGI